MEPRDTAGNRKVPKKKEKENEKSNVSQPDGHFIDTTLVSAPFDSLLIPLYTTLDKAIINKTLKNFPDGAPLL